MFALLMVLTNIVLPLASSLHLQNTRFHYFRLKMLFFSLIYSIDMQK